MTSPPQTRLSQDILTIQEFFTLTHSFILEVYDISVKFKTHLSCDLKCLVSFLNYFIFFPVCIFSPMMSYGKIQKHVFVIDVFDGAVIMAITML